MKSLQKPQFTVNIDIIANRRYGHAMTTCFRRDYLYCDKCGWSSYNLKFFGDMSWCPECSSKKGIVLEDESMIVERAIHTAIVCAFLYGFLATVTTTMWWGMYSFILYWGACWFICYTWSEMQMSDNYSYRKRLWNEKHNVTDTPTIRSKDSSNSPPKE